MKIRILEAKDEDQRWYQEAYVYETVSGQLKFIYNLLWERVGAYYNNKIIETGVSLEEIETVIEPDNDNLRWLPVEVIEDHEIETFLAKLDISCGIPKARSFSIAETLSVQ